MGQGCDDRIRPAHFCFRRTCVQFGSSECGQCAHGDRRASDLHVMSPRVIYELRDRKVCNVACGGQHSVVVSQQAHE